MNCGTPPISLGNIECGRGDDIYTILNNGIVLKNGKYFGDVINYDTIKRICFVKGVRRIKNNKRNVLKIYY